MHLRRVEDIIRRVCRRRNAAFRQCLLEYRRLVFCRAQQNDKIIRPARAKRAGLPVCHMKAAAQHRADARRAVVRLLPDCLRRFVVVRVRLEQAKLRAVVVCPVRERRACVKRFAFGVIQIAQPLTHQRREQIVDAVKHLRPRAEIAREHHAARRIIPHLVRVIIGEIFLQKNRGVCQTEAVDALLDIAHHKDVLFVIAHRAENGILDRIRVLILIDHNFGERQLPRQRGRVSRLIGQQFNSKMLEVVEIHDAAPLLFALICLHKRLHRVAQGTDRRRHHLHVQANLRLGHAEHAVRQLERNIFPHLPRLLEAVEKAFVLIAAHRRKPHAAAAHRAAQLYGGIPCAGFGQLEKRTRLIPVVQKGRLVLFPDLLCLRHFLQRAVQRRHGIADAVTCGVQQLAPPVGVRQPVKRADKLFPIGGEHARRMRGRLQIAKGLQNNVHQPPVIASRAERVDQSGKARVLARILCFEDILEHLRLHGGLFAFIRRAEIGRQADFMKMLAQQTHAECMYGRNFCAVHAHQLPPQAQIARIARRNLCQCVGNFSPHFARRGLGKCHNQKGINVTRVLGVGHAPEHALNQHSGFARACRRRDEQCPAAVFNRRLLLRCPVNAHFAPPVPVPR